MTHALKNKPTKSKRPAKSARTKPPPPRPIKVFADGLPADKAEMLRVFFANFSAHCLIAKKDKKELQTDFERAILHYINAGVSLDDALALLDIRNLGGFYARTPVLWFPLDDAAKIYPLSMEHGYMSIFRLSVYLKQSVVPELLQMALSFTIKRFPSFTTTLKKGFLALSRRLNVVLAWNRRVAFRASAESRPSARRSCALLQQLHRRRIFTFGRSVGGLMFLKALTAEYLRLMGVETETMTYLGCKRHTGCGKSKNAFSRCRRARTLGFMDNLPVR